MKTVSPGKIDKNTFNLIGKDWMLITAQKDGLVNTMTASWGGLGVFCNKDVAFIFIRPQRFTKEFVDASETFSISILPEKFRNELCYLGKVSGRDENKIERAGLTIKSDGDTPYFDEASMVFICKKLCSTVLDTKGFIQKDLCDKFFANGDFHELYIAEITKIMVK